jgi:hypothetical protein
MTAKSQADLNTEIDTQFPTNATGQITAAKLRAVTHDIVDSMGGGATFTGTGDPGLSRAQAQITSFASPPNVIRTTGFYTPGDGGGGPHVKVGSAPTNHSAWFQTADLSIYELMMEMNQLNIHQFGAKKMPNSNVQPTDPTYDNYQYWLAADKYIDAKGYAGCTLQFWPGSDYYFKTAIHMKRRAYNIKAGINTRIRTPVGIDGLITNYHYSIGHDGTWYANDAEYFVGSYIVKRNGQSGAGNAYRCTVHGFAAHTGDTLSGNNPAATYTDGTAQFKFEEFVGPGSPKDYCLNDVGADLSEIESIAFWSFWAGGVDPWETTTSVGSTYLDAGILCKCPTRWRNISVTGYNGAGVVHSGNSDYLFTGPGLSDGSRGEGLTAFYCGKAGLLTGGAEGNACTFADINTGFCGVAGIDEASFLGNVYTGCQDQFSGTNNVVRQHPIATLYNGYQWIGRIWAFGVESKPAFINEEPGDGGNHAWTKWAGDGTWGVSANIVGHIAGNTLTVESVTNGALAIGNMIAGSGVRAGTTLTAGSGTSWTTSGAAQTVGAGTAIRAMNMSGSSGGSYPDWTPTQIFDAGGAFVVRNFNSRVTFTWNYNEGGGMPAQVLVRTLVLGGQLNQLIDYSRGATIWQDGSWSTVSGVKMISTFGTPSGTNYDVGTFAVNTQDNSGVPSLYQFYAGAWHSIAGNRP